MEYVEPIKDIQTIERMKEILKNRSHRDYLLFVFGINTGILVSHLLRMKVSDVFEDNHVKDYYSLQEQKATEPKLFYINDKLKRIVADYINEFTLQADDFLFKSQKNNLPITRQQAYRIINNVAREVGLSEKIGTHTLRKTFGYHAYRKGIAVSLLQSIFNHATRAETLRYIGVYGEQLNVQIDVNL
ncbi:tyrosine-type recombinase/integrase [Bacillus suaedae]|uniref:Tyrosine-type recombinase/integrase n=1 Tax=Halalkalibacter suaedae TaxID=2822140 RepID=A0A940WXK0_9BACI|nr:tyrosine-type recombinase/integrase [Bacillus suaedae]MBP3950130.1 tyrosine-type recombinase/integrase [Bacillus suaedae]